MLAFRKLLTFSSALRKNKVPTYLYVLICSLIRFCKHIQKELRSMRMFLIKCCPQKFATISHYKIMKNSV